MATIFGDNTMVDEIRTALSGFTAALMAAMVAAGTDPLPGATYGRHESLITAVPSLTSEPLSIDIHPEQGGYSSGADHTLMKLVTCEIRTHSAHEGQFVDTVQVQRILNSIFNYITTNGNGYFDSNITGFMRVVYDDMTIAWDVFFEKTRTHGGYILFKLQVEHTHSPA